MKNQYLYKYEIFDITRHIPSDQRCRKYPIGQDSPTRKISLDNEYGGNTYERLNPSGAITLLTMLRVVEGPMAARDCAAKTTTQSKMIMRSSFIARRLIYRDMNALESQSGRPAGEPYIHHRDESL